MKFPEADEALPYTQEDKLQRELLIFASAFMNLAVVLWLSIYWMMGLHFSANVPLGYQLVSVVSLAYYFKTKNFEIFRFVQLSLFLFVPFIMQWSIGSSVTASGVALWALLSPIGALVVSGWRNSVPWFFAYITMTAISGFFDYHLGTTGASNVPMNTIGFFFALNFAAMSSIIYFLLRYFVVAMDRIKMQLDQQHQLLAEERLKKGDKKGDDKKGDGFNYSIITMLRIMTDPANQFQTHFILEEAASCRKKEDRFNYFGRLLRCQPEFALGE